MLSTRSYETFGVDAAAEMIRDEVARRGFSDGWKGYSLEVLDDMKEALQSDGIFYVDDMFGRWAHSEPRDLTH